MYPQVTAEARHADPGSLVALCACWRIVHRRCSLPQCAFGGRRTLGVTAGGVGCVMLRAPVGCHFCLYHSPSRRMVGWLSTQGLPSPSFCPSLQATALIYIICQGFLAECCRRVWRRRCVPPSHRRGPPR